MDAFNTDNFAGGLAELEYLDAVYRETLRITNPAHLSLRYASNDFKLGSIHIPRGTWIHVSTLHWSAGYSDHNNGIYTPKNPNLLRLQVNINGIHHDTKAGGADANCFVPERWLSNNDEVNARLSRNWMAFGDGTRNCVGNRFAEQAIKLVLATLFKRYVRAQ